MRAILSFIFGLATDPLGLPIEWWKEWLIMGVIGVVAFVVSFVIVGKMYDSGDVSSRAGGSLAHWLIRLAIFVALWAVTYGVIAAASFIAAHWIIVVSVLVGLSLVVAIVAIAIHLKRKGGASNG